MLASSFQWLGPAALARLVLLLNHVVSSEPQAAARSLGTFAILTQVEHARTLGLQHVYLGFWLDGHPKMDYKRKFRPLERLAGREWIDADA